MDIKIEFAKESDLEDLQKLNHILFIKEQKEYDSTFDLDWTFWEIWTVYFKDSIIRENSCALVAKDQNQIVWYLVWGITEKSSYRKINSQAELENMLILESYRGLGIWYKLVKDFFKWARSKWVERIQVTASADNIDWIKFYRKMWFKDYDITLEIEL